MNSLDSYRDSFPNARLPRSESGVLEVTLHTDGGTLVFNGHIHEQFVEVAQAEVPPGDHSREDRGRDRRHPSAVFIQ